MPSPRNTAKHATFDSGPNDEDHAQVIHKWHVKSKPYVQASRGASESCDFLVARIGDLLQVQTKQIREHQERCIAHFVEKNERLAERFGAPISHLVAPPLSHSQDLAQGDHALKSPRSSGSSSLCEDFRRSSTSRSLKSGASATPARSPSKADTGSPGRRAVSIYNRGGSFSQSRTVAETFDAYTQDDQRKSEAKIFEDTMAEVVEDVKEDAELVEALSYMKKSPLRQKLLKLVSSSLFELMFALCIFTNSILIGIHINWVATHPGKNDPLAFFILMQCYAILFLIELLLRISAEGWHFFVSSQWHWNYLDVFLVLASIFEAATEITAAVQNVQSQNANMSNFRIIRIVRVARLIRIFRILRVVRFIRGLRTLLFSIICTLKSLVWAMLLLLMIIYAFAIVFTQAIGDYLNPDHLEYDNPYVPDTDVETLHFYWGSLTEAMFTLFSAVSGGVSWRVLTNSLAEVHPVLVIVFTIYIAFVYFAVLNVVTGVFCNAAIESAQMDQDMLIAAQLADKHKYIQNVKNLFLDIDEDNTGQLTIQEFERHFELEGVQAYFSSLDLDPNDAWTLFKLLDIKCAHQVNIEEFALGCLRLRGPAKRIDVEKIIYEQQQLMKGLSSFVSLVESQLDILLLQNGLETEEANWEESGGTVQTAEFKKEQMAASIRHAQESLQQTKALNHISLLERFPYDEDVVTDRIPKRNSLNSQGSAPVVPKKGHNSLDSSNSEFVPNDASWGSAHSPSLPYSSK